MGFPENVLTSNERVVKSLHPHWLTVFVPTVVGVVVILAGTWLLTLTRSDTTGTVLDWVIIGVGVVLLLVFVLVPYLRWRTTHYVITTHRIMVRKGILNKSGKDVALARITDVSFNQTLFDRIIRAGSLQIETAGDSPDELLRNLPNSDDVQQLINHLVDADRRGMSGDDLLRGGGDVGDPDDRPPGRPGQTQPQTQPLPRDGRGDEPTWWTPTS